jgi:flagellar protein FlaG
MEISSIGRNNATLTAETPIKPQDQAVPTELVSAVKAINQTELLGEGTELMFARDRETNRPVIRIVDKNTREVLDQIPPESILSLAESLQ